MRILVALDWSEKDAAVTFAAALVTFPAALARETQVNGR